MQALYMHAFTELPYAQHTVQGHEFINLVVYF